MHNPATNTVGNLKPAGVACLFVSVEVGKTNKARPNDDRIILSVRAATAGKIKMVAPAMVNELRGFVSV